MAKAPQAPRTVSGKVPEKSPSSQPQVQQTPRVDAGPILRQRIMALQQARESRRAEIEKAAMAELARFDVAINELNGVLASIGERPVPVSRPGSLQAVQKAAPVSADDKRAQALQSIQPANILRSRLQGSAKAGGE